VGAYGVACSLPVQALPHSLQNDGGSKRRTSNVGDFTYAHKSHVRTILFTAAPPSTARTPALARRSRHTAGAPRARRSAICNNILDVGTHCTHTHRTAPRCRAHTRTRTFHQRTRYAHYARAACCELLFRITSLVPHTTPPIPLLRPPPPTIGDPHHAALSNGGFRGTACHRFLRLPRTYRCFEIQILRLTPACAFSGGVSLKACCCRTPHHPPPHSPPYRCRCRTTSFRTHTYTAPRGHLHPWLPHHLSTAGMQQAPPCCTARLYRTRLCVRDTHCTSNLARPTPPPAYPYRRQNATPLLHHTYTPLPARYLTKSCLPTFPPTHTLPHPSTSPPTPIIAPHLTARQGHTH